MKKFILKPKTPFYKLKKYFNNTKMCNFYLYYFVTKPKMRNFAQE